MSDHDNGKYKVYYVCEDDREGVRCFETDGKPWDNEDWEWELLAAEIAEWIYDNTDGWEWWKPDDSVTLQLFWGEGDSEGAAEALRGTFNVIMFMSPTFSARPK
jgi:hypothetical protein